MVRHSARWCRPFLEQVGSGPSLDNTTSCASLRNSHGREDAMRFHGLLVLTVLAHGVVQAATGPRIEYVQVDRTSVPVNGSIDVPLTQGQSFQIRIRVDNPGDDSPGEYHCITLGSPQFSSLSDKGRVRYAYLDSDMKYGEYYGLEATGGSGEAEYVLVEATERPGQVWDGGFWSEKNSLEVEVTPKSYGPFDVYYRVAMSEQESWKYGWTHLPFSSSYLDALGYPASRLSVNANFACTRKAATTLSIGR